MVPQVFGGAFMKGGLNMTATEELLVFLELNGYDVNKFKYQMQLTKELQGNTNLLQQNTIQNFLEEYYSSTKVDLLHSNPFIYTVLWEQKKVDKEKVSIEDFYITHERVEEDLTIYQFVNDQTIKDDIKIRILSDQITKWIREYKSYIKRSLFVQNEWLELMTREVEYQQTPPITKLIIAIVTFLLVIITLSPPFMESAIYLDAIMNQFWFMLYTILFVGFILITISKYDHYRQKFKRVKGKEYTSFQKKRQNILTTLETVEIDLNTLIDQDEIVPKKVFIKRINRIIKINNKISRYKNDVIFFESIYLFVIKHYISITSKIDNKNIVIITSFVLYIVMGFLLGKGFI